MSRIVAGMTMSLDGFVHDSRGSSAALYRDLADWRHQERGRASIAATGAVLMGRKTFEMAGDPDHWNHFALANNLTLGYTVFSELERSHPQIEGCGLRGETHGERCSQTLRQSQDRKEVWVTVHGHDAGQLGYRILKDAGVL